MAEGGANPSLGGYDDEFVNAVDEELQCVICHLPLKDPFLTRCGHRFCKTCLDEHFESQKRTQGQSTRVLSFALYGSWQTPIRLSCPSDRNQLVQDKDIFPDKATERKILSLHIKCPIEGCEWTGELRGKENHFSSCPLKVVSCTNQNCRVTLTRNLLLKHLTTSCEWRTLSCTYCSMSYPACKTQDHERQCRRKPIMCTNYCGATLPREEIPAHKENDCPLAIVSCPYAQMGCTKKVQRREVESHLQCATRVHLDLACVKLNYTQEELKKSQEVIRKLDVKFETLENKLKLSEEKRTMLEEKVTKLDKEQVNRGEFEELEARFNAPKNTWKINNFSEVLRKAKAGEETEIYSAPFYDYGYKFKLELNPNGYGAGENTHLSIYIKIMKTDYDAVLPWPFHKKVTFTLIDQQQEEKDKENIVESFIADPKLDSFPRPETDSNDGWGFTQFVSHTDLRTRRYVVDDAILIQVKIDPP